MIRLGKLIRFTNDSAALEKILRLLQAFSQILGSTTSLGTKPLHARRQLALGRRNFRFFRFLSSFTAAYDVILNINPSSGIENVLLVGKHAFMGMYLGGESLTLLDTMGLRRWEGAQWCLIEGNKFWFYSLLCSILLHLITLMPSLLSSLFGDGIPPTVPPKSPARTSPKPVARSKSLERSKVAMVREKTRKKSMRERNLVWRKIVSDVADLLVSGAVVGWIPASAMITGYAGALSSTLGLWEIWEKMR